MKKIIQRLNAIDERLAELGRHWERRMIKHETYVVLLNRMKWEKIGILETLKAFGIEAHVGEGRWAIRLWDGDGEETGEN